MDWKSTRAVWISYEVIIDTRDAITDSAEDHDAILTASHLPEELQSFEFHLSFLFMKNAMPKMEIMVPEVQEIKQDILSCLVALCHTRGAILRIRNDEIGLDGILKFAVEKYRSSAIHTLYEFLKKHRPHQPKRIDGNRDNFSTPSFETHHVQEMFEVVDRLASDIKDIIDYLSKIVVPVIVLLLGRIKTCDAGRVQQLCDAFPDDIKDLDALIAEKEMVGPDISNSKSKTIERSCHVLSREFKLYPSLAKAYQPGPKYSNFSCWQ